MKKINPIKTGYRITDLMEDNNISAYELCEELLVTKQAIYKWRSGKMMPSIDSLVILADILGVKIDDILVIEDV